MEQNYLKGLTDEQLLQEHKKLKSGKITTAFLIGALIGVAVYSAIKNGIGFFSFFPLFFVYLLFNNGKKAKAVKEELKSRDIK